MPIKQAHNFGAQAFYESYSAYKSYQPVSLNAKDISRFDAEIWHPANFEREMRCLEIGAGTGVFLSYLSTKGMSEFYGIDRDPALKSIQLPEIRGKFECVDIWTYLEREDIATFDRIVMLDVLEHFSPEDGFRLLTSLKTILNENGKIVVKVPNASSPWGMSYQFGDLTHLTAYTPDSLRQMGVACGLNIDLIYEQKRGSRKRRVLDAMLGRLLSLALLSPPELWGANIYSIYSNNMKTQ